MKKTMAKSIPDPIAAGDKRDTETRPPLRVAAYFQYDGDDHSTYESLCGHYYDKITNNPDWTLAGIFSDPRDNAASKRSYPNRQRLLTKCRKGNVDRIIVRSMGQFARNLRQFQEVTQELIALGIGVYFEKENISAPEEYSLCIFMAELARRESEFITRNSTHMKYMTCNYTKSKHPRRKTVNLGFTFDKVKE